VEKFSGIVAEMAGQGNRQKKRGFRDTKTALADPSRESASGASRQIVFQSAFAMQGS
jgi:hypothetical protein